MAGGGGESNCGTGLFHGGIGQPGLCLSDLARLLPSTDRGAQNMPTVLRWGPYRAFFYSNEAGEPPHIHVRSGGHEAMFWLHDLSLAVNAGFPAHEIGSIIRHLRSQRDVLEGKWHEHFGN
jgi:hypothetical protein